jgi:ATP-binding cassette subfamily C (CFTR/MRP) protein 1
MSHMAESVNGASTIRAFNVCEYFSRRNADDVNKFMRVRLTHTYSHRWLDLRIEGLSHLMLLAAGLLGVVSSNVSPNSLGMATVYALRLPNILGDLLRSLARIEKNLLAFMRVLQYVEELPQEAESPGPVHTDQLLRGEIEFRDFTARYAPHLPAALDKINLRFRAGEKIGVVGRTGAGKSTLMSSLFRMVEGENGGIYIDGVSLTDLGPRDLRRRLAVVPQDGGVFSGSLGQNLDPTKKIGKAKLQASLRESGLEASLRSSGAIEEDLLEYSIGSGGGGLSAGQRQLLCLGNIHTCVF